jgi:hypothetical protein
MFLKFQGFVNEIYRLRIKLRATCRANYFIAGITATVAPSEGIDDALIGAVPAAVRAKARFNALAGLAVVAFAPLADHRGQLYAAEF